MIIDSNVTILRWRGGEGGDTLLNMIVGSNPNMHSNVAWSDTDLQGKTVPIEITTDHTFAELPNVVNIAIGHRFHQVSLDDLKSSITKLKAVPKIFMLKSHWYTSSMFNDITIDLTTSLELLPFVIHANVHKNNHTAMYCNQLREKIKNPNIRSCYDLYTTCWDRLYNAVEYSDHQINVETMLSGWDRLKEVLGQFGLVLNNKYKDYYNEWLDKNQQYLPSNRYKELVRTSDFSYSDSTLSLAERYCLLAMAKKKFTILH